jgi:hypothetical protein
VSDLGHIIILDWSFRQTTDTNRLHHVCYSNNPFGSIEQEHIGFRWLSTACPLDGLRDSGLQSFQPFSIGERPCQELFRPTASETGKRGEVFYCPLYSVCAYHQAQRDLVQAQLWITTPAGLIYSRVASQLNPERPRFAELVYRRSDLVIVDEADQVQVQLDTVFSPSQILAGGNGDAWLDRLSQQVDTHLRQRGRGQLATENVDTWVHAHGIIQTVTNRIYGLLLREPALKSRTLWGDYFTDWLLFSSLARTLSGIASSADESNPDYERLMKLFNAQIDDPFGVSEETQLSRLVLNVIGMTDSTQVRNAIRTWIGEHLSTKTDLSEEELQQCVVQMEFALLVSVLQDRLNMLLHQWPQVEEPLNLESIESMLSNRPPEDLIPLIPSTPMGNLLAFQYVRSTAGSDEPGTLRFFRCTGVGRWILLHFHELYAGDGLVGPHVLLLSGSSWAGTSPHYHLQVLVSGILRAQPEEIAAIENSSEFQLKIFYDDQFNPIRVSGTSGDARASALKSILYQLARRSGMGGPSLLEKERANLAPGRQRVLLIVGSYAEAQLVRDYLEQVRADWLGQVLALIPDDEAFESNQNATQRSLQRGLVHHFADTGAWILVAPLLAIERGHNILNENQVAAIGSAYFLVRPHPRPDDLGFAIHSINRWSVDHYADKDWLEEHLPNESISLSRVGQVFRSAAFQRWRYLLRLPMMYGSLPEQERTAVTWNLLVTILQVIGRLVRGGSPARVYFCDAAFAERTAQQDERPDDPSTSLLVSIRQVLRPYFENPNRSMVSNRERAIVQSLYKPFYNAMIKMGGIANGSV